MPLGNNRGQVWSLAQVFQGSARPLVSLILSDLHPKDGPRRMTHLAGGGRDVLRRRGGGAALLRRLDGLLLDVDHARRALHRHLRRRRS